MFQIKSNHLLHNRRKTLLLHVMPLNPRNVDATYQRMMNRMFTKRIGLNMEVYVYDMLVKSKESAHHETYLNETFDVLRRFNMKLKPNNCAFGVTLRRFFGFIVHQCRIELNIEKVQAVLMMESPKNLKQLQSLNHKVTASNSFCIPCHRQVPPLLWDLKEGHHVRVDGRLRESLHPIKEIPHNGATLVKTIQQW